MLGAVIKFWVVEVILAVLNLVEDLLLLVSLEWQIATHKDVEENAEGPDINLRVIYAI